MGVASLILGIMGLVISIVWGKWGIFALLLAIPAVILGAIARTGKGHKTMPTIGLVLGCIAMPLALISSSFWLKMDKLTNGCSNSKIERSFNWGTKDFDKNESEDSDNNSKEDSDDSAKRLEDKMDKLSDAIEEKLNKMFFED